MHLSIHKDVCPPFQTVSIVIYWKEIYSSNPITLWPDCQCWLVPRFPAIFSFSQSWVKVCKSAIDVVFQLEILVVTGAGQHVSLLQFLLLNRCCSLARNERNFAQSVNTSSGWLANSVTHLAAMKFIYRTGRQAKIEISICTAWCEALLLQFYTNTANMKCKSCGIMLNGVWKEVYYQNGLLSVYLQCLTCYSSKRKSVDLSVNSENHYSCAICTRSYSAQNHLQLHLAIHTAMGRKDTKLEDSISLDADGIVPFDFELKPLLPHKDPITKASATSRPVSSAKFTQVITPTITPPKSSKLKVNCPVCDAEFFSLKRLKLHCRSLHSAQMPFICAICSKGFAQEIGLIRHLSSAHSTVEPQCDCSHCDSLNQRYTVDKIKRKTRLFLCPGRLYDCPFCLKLLSDAGGLRQHLRSHAPNQTPTSCPNCHECLKNPAELARHSRLCKFKYSCRQCTKRFSSKFHLNLHMNEAHWKPRNFRCPVCKKAFSDRRNVKSHEKSHLVNKSLHCPTCQRKFTSAQQWENHVSLHNADKPFYCTLCHRYFRRRHHIILKHCR